MTGNSIKADLCVIGGGSGGLSAAAGAAQLGARVVLLEGGKMGGDCLNYGCVPSKSLIAAGKHAYAMTDGKKFGVQPVTPEVDFAVAKDHVSDVISRIEPHDSVERFEGLGVTVISEYGSFTSPRTVQAGDTQIEARRFVIATGSSPFVPPIPGLADTPHETNETIFESRRRPEHLLVIGGGPIGMELAQAHRRLGCQVTVLEGLKVLARSHPEHSVVVVDQMKSEGITIREGSNVEKVEGVDGEVSITTADGRITRGSHILVAAGRKPNTARLNLEAAGISVGRAGITVDRRMKTSNRRVYAIGDVAGGPQFTHVAGYHAGIVVRSALFGLPARVRDDHIPSATYTDPEIAEIGLSEDEVSRRTGRQPEVVTFDYERNDRALAEGITRGQARVLVLKGRPVGVSIVGPGAGELIQLWSLVIANRMKMVAIANMIAPYPTLGEINKGVASAFFSKRLFGDNRIRKFVRFIQRW